MRLTQIMILLTVLALSCLVAGCGGGGGGTVDNVDKTAPIITDTKATVPTGFSFPGGDVPVSVTATDNIGVSSVVVNIKNSLTGVTTTKTLTKKTGNTYEGTASIFFNGSDPGTQTFTLTVVVSDAAGNKTNKLAGTIQIELEAPPGVPT